MEVEIPRPDQHTLKTPSFKFPYKNYHHQQSFELKVIYLRIIINCSSNYNMKSSINLFFPPRDPQTCLEINGFKINPSEKATRVLNRHREDAFMSESIYINIDTIRFKGFCLPFQVQIQGSSSSSLVLVSGSLRLNDNGLISGSTPYNYKEDLKWVLECKEGEGEENCCNVINGGLVDAYFAGRSSGKPFLLNEFVKLKKKISCRGLDCIDEGDETDGLINSKEQGEKHIKEFEQRANDPQDINIDEEEEMFLEEEGQLSWFSAGVRVGIGLGVGLSIGVGMGLGLIKRTFKSSYRVFNRVLY